MAALTNMLTNPDFASNITGWNGINTVWSSGRAAMTATAPRNTNQVVTLISGHKYYFRSTVEATTNSVYAGFIGYSGNYTWVSTTGSPAALSNIITATANANVNWVCMGDTRASGWDTVYADNCMVIDLTADFGAGSEPDLATCDAWDFFAGTIVDAADSLLLKLTESAALDSGFALTAVQDGTHIDLSWA